MTVIDAGHLDEDDLDEDSAAEHIHGICLKTGPPRRFGVELEWLVRDARDPSLPVAAERIADAVSAFDAARADRARIDKDRIDKDSAGSGGAGRDGGGSGGANGDGNGSQRKAGGSRAGRGRADGDRGDPGENGDRSAGDGGRGAGPALPTSSRPGVLPSGAPLTTEPGGQLELSSQPADSLPDLIRATTADAAALRAVMAARGLELAGIGLDPLRPPRRVLQLPRYAAMEAFFDRGGPWGRQMMCSTASVQVCLDAGDDSDGPAGYRYRWQLVHAVGPVLVAAFANSPLRGGKPTGWVSSRQQVWARMDPGRTRPPHLAEDPRGAWARYALDAELMCVRDPDSADWSAPPRLTFRDWVRGAAVVPCEGPMRRPTAADLEYHLSTLFPPVRPRGHLELRMIDAQPGDGWIVPLAVSSALLSDARASEAALAAVAPLWDGHPPGAGTAGNSAAGNWAAGNWAAGDWPARDGAGRDVTAGDGPWLRAARLGPADPAISRASSACFAAAREALDRMAVPAEITAAVDAFHATYVSRDRCPADDLLEEAR